MQGEEKPGLPSFFRFSILSYSIPSFVTRNYFGTSVFALN